MCIGRRPRPSNPAAIVAQAIPKPPALAPKPTSTPTPKPTPKPPTATSQPKTPTSTSTPTPTPKPETPTSPKKPRRFIKRGGFLGSPSRSSLRIGGGSGNLRY